MERLDGRSGNPRPIGEILDGMPLDFEGRQQPRTAPKTPRPVSQDGRGKDPLCEGGFTPFPRILDDFLIELGKYRGTRSVAKALQIVCFDLMRFTDNANRDVIVTNQAIADRRCVGMPTVKAAIRLLLEMNVLRKTEPTEARRAELLRVPGGFGGNRRYLVWNPQAQWQLPRAEAEIFALGHWWNDCLARAGSRHASRY